MSQPISRNGKYLFDVGPMSFEVDPETGGRITRFSLDGENVIADESVTGDPINWGSTSWPSPQSDWGVPNNWPPPAWIDREPYAVIVDGHTIELRSAPAPDAETPARVSVVKRFSMESAARGVKIELRVKNEGPGRRWAPWQVTRVAGNGLSFFPTGAAPECNTLATTESRNVTWYRHPDGLPVVDSPIAGGKLSGHAGTPWLAHVCKNLLFVQTFPRVAATTCAPSHGEVEIYASNTGNYVEVETQGPYTFLPTGESLVWTLRWHLHRLPANVNAQAGDIELLKFVEELLE